jgi:hypothetical protein
MAESRGPGTGAPSPATSPFRPGPLSLILARVGRLPGGGWWVFVPFGAALFAWGQFIEWAVGRMPVGTFDPNLLAVVPYGPWVLLGLGIGLRIARRALESFWPATGWPDADRAGWAQRFAGAPFWPEVAALLVGSIAGVVSLVVAIDTLVGPGPHRTAVFVAYLPSFLAGYAMSAAGGLITVRWLLLVSRIHREATAVDIFDRVPIYAFSRLTVVVGISYVFAGYYSLTVNAASQAGNLASIGSIGATFVVASASFVVPLWGIHGRLAREKEALLRDAERRANALAAELYARIDAGKYDETAVINSSLTGVTALRERYERLPTWPWPPQVLRGFVSALLLPLVIFILTRVISDLI